MTINPASAVAAYGNSARAALPVAAPELRQPLEPSFTSLIEKAATGAIDTSRAAEQQTFAAAAGKADLTDVVTSVANAEVTLQSVMAIRDKVVTAYQEILRMPI